MSLNISVTIPLPAVAAIMSGQAVDYEHLGYLVANAVRKLSKTMLEPAIPREDSAVDMSILLRAEDQSVDEREFLRQRGIQKMAALRQPAKMPSDGRGYIEVMWDFHGCYPLVVSANTTGSQLNDMISEKTGIPVEQQRIAYKERLLRSSDTLEQHRIQPIYATANRPRLKFSRLEGLCFKGAELDFSVLVGGERTSKKQVHACRSTRLSEIAEAFLLNKDGSPYRLVSHGKVVYDSAIALWTCGEDDTVISRTVGSINVQPGDVLRLQRSKPGSERTSSIASSIASDASTGSSRASVSTVRTSIPSLERCWSQNTEVPLSEKRPSMLRKVFTS